MGHLIADQYSLLHFSTGVISYFWQIPFLLGFLIHIIFEIVENTEFGMSIINRYFVNKGSLFQWPGGKYKADTFINSMGDNIFYAVGWILSYLLDYYGSKKGWYSKHNVE